ncbi:MAG TPA: hypothetical protein GX514_02355 [Thermoanaerobacterales bacterium]|nr:hypothetical protein [Thermoanaerobacterales bacterium]
MNNISHAYIFLGTEDETTKEALKLAQIANCENSQMSPCGFCNSCRKIQNDVHPDVVHVYPEGASIKIEQVRQLILDLAEKPVEGNKKLYILHQAHTMTPQAQNALLKTLEEPLTESIIVLLSSNLKQLIPTVISRCQIRDFSQEVKPLISINTRQSIANLLLHIVHSKKISELGALVTQLSETDEKAEEILEFIISLYRDVLVAKTNSSVAFINGDLESIIYKFAAQLTLNAILLSIEVASEQLKATKSRGNQNLIWYNLLMGLEEVV